MAFIRHLTLTGGAVSTVTFTDTSSRMEIVNRDAADEVFVSYNGTATPSDPTVGGNDFDIVPKVAGATVGINRTSSAPIVVKLLAAVATKVTVRGVP
jgi:hypothetical protein